MKNNILLTFFCIALLTCLFMGNSGGRATDARRGNTGAPGDEAQTCAGCHNSGDYQVTMKIELFDANNILVDAYEPEKTYLAKATILASGANVPKAYGVQMLSLIDKLGTNTIWMQMAGLPKRKAPIRALLPLTIVVTPSRKLQV
jgi:hypothetical protein